MGAARTQHPARPCGIPRTPVPLTRPGAAVGTSGSTRPRTAAPCPAPAPVRAGPRPASAPAPSTRTPAGESPRLLRRRSCRADPCRRTRSGARACCGRAGGLWLTAHSARGGTDRALTPRKRSFLGTHCPTAGSLAWHRPLRLRKRHRNAALGYCYEYTNEQLETSQMSKCERSGGPHVPGVRLLAVCAAYLLRFTPVNDLTSPPDPLPAPALLAAPRSGATWPPLARSTA